MSKTAMVTGAMGGIGQAVSFALADAGYRIVGVDIKSGQDVRDEAMMRTLAERQIDVLVCAHGRSHLGSIETLTAEDVEKVWRLNVQGTINAVKAVVPQMKARAAGHIILIGSLRGIDFRAGKAAYGMSKAALRALALTLHEELWLYHVGVTLINPGFTETDQIRQRILDEELEMWDLTQPEDIAATVMWRLKLTPGADVPEVSIGRIW